MNHLILFDIDATLLLTGGVGMRAMEQAGLEVLGPALSWQGIEASGGLDPQLVREAATRSSIAFDGEVHSVFRARYTNVLKEALARGGPGLRTMPGVPEILGRLGARPDVTLGLLTGNYGETAILKLRSVGIDPGHFALSVWGDEAPTRPGLVRVALAKYADRFGTSIDPGRVILIGDTPRDVDAALSNGCIAVGVATGKYSMEALRDAGAHVVLQDLGDPSAIERILEEGRA